MDWCEWFGFDFDPFFDKPLETDQEVASLMVIEKNLEEQIQPLIRQMKKVPFICLVSGERGIGKSTFLYYFNNLTAKSSYLPVYVALDHSQLEFSSKPPYEIQKSLLYEFGVKLLEAVEKLKKSFFDKNRVTHLELARYLGLSYQETEGFVPAKERFRLDLFELKRYIIAVLRLLKNSEVPIVLSVDNLDRINDTKVLESFFRAPGAQSLFDELRKEGVSLLIAMSNAFVKLQKQKSDLNYLNQIVNLAPLSPTQVLELVDKRIAYSNQPSPSNPFDSKAILAISIKKKGITREIITEARSICIKAYEQKVRSRISEEFALKGLVTFDESRTFYEIVAENEAVKEAAMNLCELSLQAEIPIEEAVQNICSLERNERIKMKSEFLTRLIDLKIIRTAVSEEYTLAQSVSNLFDSVKKGKWNLEDFLRWIFTKESLKVLVNGIPGSNVRQAIEGFGPIPQQTAKTIYIIVAGTQETYQSARLVEEALDDLEEAKRIATYVGKLAWDDINNIAVYQDMYRALCDFLDSFSKLYICCASSKTVKIKSWKKDDFFENIVHHFQDEHNVTFKSFYRFQHFSANINGLARGGFTPSHSHVRTAFDDFVAVVQEFTKIWQSISSRFYSLEVQDKEHDDTSLIVGEFSSLLGYTNERPEFKRFEINGEEYFKLGFSSHLLNEAAVDIVTEKTIINRLNSIMSYYFVSSVSPNSRIKTTEKDILCFVKKAMDLTTKITASCKNLSMVEGFPKYFLVYVTNSGFEIGIRAAIRTAILPPNSQIFTLDRYGLLGLMQQLKLPSKKTPVGGQEEDIDVLRRKDLETLLGLHSKIAEIIHENFEKQTTILLADLENFTRRTEENRLESAEAVEKMSQIFRHEIDLYGGTGMNTEGDSFIAFFDKTDQAVLAALKAVEQIKLYNEGVQEQRKIFVHVGLSTGEVLFNNGRPFIGDAVNIAARIMKKIESNKIAISEATFKEISGYRGFTFTNRGFEELKGIKKPIQIYEVELCKIDSLT